MPLTDMREVVNEMQSRFTEIQKVRRVQPGEHIVLFFCSKGYEKNMSVIIEIFCKEFYMKNEALFDEEEEFWGSVKYYADLHKNPLAEEISCIARRKIIALLDEVAP